MSAVFSVFGDMSKFVAFEAFCGLDVAFEKLAMLDLVAPVNLLTDHFIRLFRFNDTDQEGPLSSVTL